ncbi:MAG TPA: DUF1697 domain-containing protein [Longimicrobiales bacterium]|nr:DUF1697 domain-containing protein [Longimicrobiales bacterium]
MRSSAFVCLIRGINVGGRNVVPMAELRSVCTDLGWTGVQSYIQSGNLILYARAAPVTLEAELERGIERHFGLSVAVIVRRAEEWQTCIESNPFEESSRREPSLVMLALSKLPPEADAEGRLRERATSGERIVRVGDALWIHYPGGAGRSKLSPGLVDRLVGSPVTTRNWRTVLRIGELAQRALERE